MAPRHDFLFDAGFRYILGTTAFAAVLYTFTPYVGPALAKPSEKEKEALALTMRFSPNPALSTVLEKDIEDFRSAQ
jgi:hypothetical protein